MENIQKIFNQAVKELKIADHMTYVTYPLVSEHKLLLKIFNEIYNSITDCIKALLTYESVHKKIQIYADPKDNLQTFIKLSKQYKLNNEQIKIIVEILELYKKHKKSAMEFVKNNKIVILSDNLQTQTLDLQTIKIYLNLAKALLVKTNKKIIE